MTDQSITVRPNVQQIAVTSNAQQVAAKFGPEGPRGPKGDPGPAGSTGVPGPKGDPGTTDYNGLTNRPDLSDFTSRPAGGTTTTGDVIVLGATNRVASDLGTAAILGGGAPNYENVIGGASTATVDTPASNLPAVTGTGADWSVIIGGYDNVVRGWACQVQGYHVKVEQGANHCTTGGGSKHVVDGGIAYATVGGGTQNHLTADGATIGGGTRNTAGQNAALGGGVDCIASGVTSVVGGGNQNTATASGATVSGGFSNDATGSNSSIAGGQNNAASASAATVVGGNSNTASNNQATVTGGTNNTANAISATVGGGQFNTASGVAATVVGGRENNASGPAATAIGREANASMEGMTAFASGKFAANGDAQAANLVMRNQTTTATVTELFLNGASGRLVLPDDTTWAYRVTVAARRTDADNESAAYTIAGCIDRNAGAASTALVGTPTVAVLGEDTAAWDVTADADTTNGSLRLRVTGEAAKTVRWVARVELTCVTG